MLRGTEPLLDVEEVAKFFKYEPRTIKKWVSDGKLKCCNIPSNELRFDPDYIRSFKTTDFKHGVSSPEVYRLQREHAKDIKVRDEIISKLIRMVRGDYINHTKNINEILVIEEQLGLMESN